MVHAPQRLVSCQHLATACTRLGSARGAALAPMFAPLPAISLGEAGIIGTMPMAAAEPSRGAVGLLKSPLLLAPNERGQLPDSRLELWPWCGCRWCAQLSRSVRPNSCRGQAGGRRVRHQVGSGRTLATRNCNSIPCSTAKAPSQPTLNAAKHAGCCPPAPRSTPAAPAALGRAPQSAQSRSPCKLASQDAMEVCRAHICRAHIRQRQPLTP